MNNYEKIKNMSIDEIAEEVAKSECWCIHNKYCDGSEENEKICQNGIKQYLESEAK